MRAFAAIFLSSLLIACQQNAVVGDAKNNPSQPNEDQTAQTENVNSPDDTNDSTKESKPVSQRREYATETRSGEIDAPPCEDGSEKCKPWDRNWEDSKPKIGDVISDDGTITRGEQ